MDRDMPGAKAEIPHMVGTVLVAAVPEDRLVLEPMEATTFLMRTMVLPVVVLVVVVRSEPTQVPGTLGQAGGNNWAGTLGTGGAGGALIQPVHLEQQVVEVVVPLLILSIH